MKSHSQKIIFNQVAIIATIIVALFSSIILILDQISRHSPYIFSAMGISNGCTDTLLDMVNNINIIDQGKFTSLNVRQVVADGYTAYILYDIHLCDQWKSYVTTANKNFPEMSFDIQFFPTNGKNGVSSVDLLKRNIPYTVKKTSFVEFNANTCTYTYLSTFCPKAETQLSNMTLLLGNMSLVAEEGSTLVTGNDVLSVDIHLISNPKAQISQKTSSTNCVITPLGIYLSLWGENLDHLKNDKLSITILYKNDTHANNWKSILSSMSIKSEEYTAEITAIPSGGVIRNIEEIKEISINGINVYTAGKS